MREVMLSTLAIDALEDYVNGLFIKFLNELDNVKLKIVCRNLKEMLIDFVPPPLVNEVTLRLLRGLDNSFSLIRIEYTVIEIVAKHFVNAVIHPYVTKLHFGPEFLHEYMRGFDWNYIALFVYYELGNLNRLKYFRMSTDLNVMLGGWNSLELGMVGLPSTLHEFTFMNHCNDSIIGTLCESCQNLKCLNVSKSIYVSNLSVGSILKLKHLVQLNLENTNIAEGGVTELLKGLTESTVSRCGYLCSCASQLLTFGCSNVTSSHVHTLAMNFPNLICVVLTCGKSCNLLELKEMYNVNALSLSYVKYPQIENLLVSLGSQIQYLDIYDVGPINVMAIGEACTLLKCLHIMSSDTSSIPPADDFCTPLA
ncbi:hypothetical protein L9F63_020377, partial [Diploptera punctata]